MVILFDRFRSAEFAGCLFSIGAAFRADAFEDQFVLWWDWWGGMIWQNSPIGTITETFHTAAERALTGMYGILLSIQLVNLLLHIGEHLTIELVIADLGSEVLVYSVTIERIVAFHHGKADDLFRRDGLALEFGGGLARFGITDHFVDI